MTFSQLLTEKGFPNTDLTDNEWTKTHIRYMVGGKSAEVKRKVLYRFLFPERPNALPRFLASMGENWNISLFHYRMQG